MVVARMLTQQVARAFNDAGADYAAAGAGLVFMDGITRFDLAHGLGREGGRLQAALKFHLQGDVLF